MKIFFLLFLSLNFAYADSYRDELNRYNMRDLKLKKGLQDLKPEYEQEKLADLEEESPKNVQKPEDSEEPMAQDPRMAPNQAQSIDLNTMPMNPNMTKEQAMELGRRLKSQQMPRNR